MNDFQSVAKEARRLAGDISRAEKESAFNEDPLRAKMNVMEQARAKTKHSNFIGVSDPTGFIPKGHVFLTGMGNSTPSKVFLSVVRYCVLKTLTLWKLLILEPCHNHSCVSMP